MTPQTAPSSVSRRARRRPRRPWLPTLGLAVLGVGALALWPRPAAVPDVQVEAVRQELFLKTVGGSGTVKAEVSRTLSFVGTSNVAELRVKLGDEVQPGQRLARLDTAATERELQAARLALTSAETDLLRAQVGSAETERDLKRQVANARAALEGARTAYADAERGAQLQARLLAVGTASAQDLRTAQTSRDEARRKAEAAERDLTFALSKANTAGPSVVGAQSTLEAARVRVQNLEKSIRDAELRSPVAGVVSAVNVSVGTPAPGNQPALEITDPARLYLEIPFDETRAAALRPGQPAEVKFDALPRRTFAGTVDRVSPVAREAGQVAAVAVRVRLRGADGVKPGFTGTVTVITRRLPGALTVPLEAGREEGGTTRVWRVTPSAQPTGEAGEGTASPVTVRFVDRNASRAVVEGLRAGDLIVTPAPEALPAGTRVRHQPAPSGEPGADSSGLSETGATP